MYIAHKRARFTGIHGKVNIPYGTELEVHGDFIVDKRGNSICAVTSKNSHDFFSPNDDGEGLLRGKLVMAIKCRLAADDWHFQDRWDKVWEDTLCARYRRKDHDDYWLWNHEFYGAPIQDLKYIAHLVGAKEVK